jgi:hypothetical protein
VAKKRKDKRGRPIKLNQPRIRSRFVDSLRKTGSLTKSCKAAGITFQTLRNSIKRDPEFAALVKEVEDETLQAIADNVMECARKDPHIGLKVLERKRKDWIKLQPDQPDPQPNIHLHAHEHRVEVIEDDNWYGNQSHNSIAETIATPVANPPLAGPVQGGSVRPALGQNGHGSNGHDPGPRAK